MGKVYREIDEPLAEWIGRQAVFFVATAPSSGGHVNLSPKGLDDTFAIIDPHTVAYLDVGGSGAETIAHLRDNGRITIMLCAFGGSPRILRLYGRGEVHYAGDSEFDAISHRFGSYRARSIITISVDRIADSCGFGVPEMDLRHQRSQLVDWLTAKTDAELVEYQASNNRLSIDGLPAMDLEA